jgi:hypothetical protein
MELRLRNDIRPCGADLATSHPQKTYHLRKFQSRVAKVGLTAFYNTGICELTIFAPALEWMNRNSCRLDGVLNHRCYGTPEVFLELSVTRGPRSRSSMFTCGDGL